MEQTVVRIRTLEIGSGMPKICVPVVGKTEKEILEGAERAKAVQPDLVEFRVDWYEAVADSQKVVALLEKLRKCLGELPLLFTFRSSREGGEAALIMILKKHLQQKNSLPDFRRWKHLVQIFQRLPLCHKAARMF